MRSFLLDVNVQAGCHVCYTCQLTALHGFCIEHRRECIRKSIGWCCKCRFPLLFVVFADVAKTLETQPTSTLSPLCALVKPRYNSCVVSSHRFCRLEYLKQLVDYEDNYDAGIVFTKRESLPARPLGTLAAFMNDLYKTVRVRGRPVAGGVWTLEHLDVLELALSAEEFGVLVSAFVWSIPVLTVLRCRSFRLVNFGGQW